MAEIGYRVPADQRQNVLAQLQAMAARLEATITVEYQPHWHQMTGYYQ